MDLIGKCTPLEEGWLHTETKDGANQDEKNVIIKGVIVNKVTFDKRPCPNMERASLEPRIEIANNLFKQLDIKS